MDNKENVAKFLESLKDGGPSEELSKETFIRAEKSLKTMCIMNVQDAFLFYASLNFLNSYVKVHKDEVKYKFKSHVNEGIEVIMKYNIPDCTFSYDNVEKSTSVNILGMQFSFHFIKPSEVMKSAMENEDDPNHKFYKQEKWSGIRLQPVAESVFNFANNLEGLSNISLAGNLREYQDECVLRDKYNIENDN